MSALASVLSDLVVLGLSLSYIPVSRIVFSLITVTVSSNLIDWIKEYKTQKDCEKLQEVPSAKRV